MYNLVRNIFRDFLVLITFSVLLTGCYFSSGTKFNEPALEHREKANSAVRVLEIRAQPWHTGNAHIPFDFTVYKYDVVYELVIPNNPGRYTEAEIKLSGCGVNFIVKMANIDVTSDTVRFNIVYNYENSDSPYPEKISGALHIEPSKAEVKSCVKPPFYTK
jgi:hypothetical protein